MVLAEGVPDIEANKQITPIAETIRKHRRMI